MRLVRRLQYFNRGYAVKIPGRLMLPRRVEAKIVCINHEEPPIKLSFEAKVSGKKHRFLWIPAKIVRFYNMKPGDIVELEIHG